MESESDAGLALRHDPLHQFLEQILVKGIQVFRPGLYGIRRLMQPADGVLDIVVDNERWNVIREILQEFVHLYHQKNNIAEVEVQSAVELSTAQAKKLESALENLLKQKVLVSYLVKPEVLGGLKVKYGSKMIDDTLLGKLNRMEQVMKGGQ